MIYGDISGRDRELLYLPIVHTQVDMGSLGTSIAGAKASAIGQSGAARAAARVQRLWDEIESFLNKLPDNLQSVRVYQDGLAVCGRETEIVTELAEAGSRNYALLLKLQARGAVLMGTESPELLVEEYRLALAAFAPGAVAGRGKDRLRDSLLDRRDRFIAERIDQTLLAGETAILLIGMLHKIGRFLPPGIAVHYPLAGSSGK